MKIADTHQEKISELVQQLDKLLKVIRHSDPSAENKKLLLFNKYQQQSSLLVEELKNIYSWNNIKEYLLQTIPTYPFLIDKDILKIITGKLVKDFEKLFVSKPILQEFTQPDPVFQKNQSKPTVTVRRYKRIIPDENQNYPTGTVPIFEQRFTREKLMEIARETQRKIHAVSELRNLIEAIKQVGPETIENKIIQEVDKKL